MPPPIPCRSLCGQQGRHVRGGRGDHTANAIQQRGDDLDAFHADAPAKQCRCSPSNDRADLVEQDRPADIGDTADLIDDCRRDGGRDQRIGGVQPHAQAEQYETAKQARNPQAFPGPAQFQRRHADPLFA